jgi:hypothetical protein
MRKTNAEILRGAQNDKQKSTHPSRSTVMDGAPADGELLR